MEVVFATSNTWITQDVMTTEGEAWDANDPIVKAHRQFFTDDPKYAHRSGPLRPIEDASADPSEGRTARKPRAEATRSRKSRTATR